MTDTVTNLHQGYALCVKFPAIYTYKIKLGNSKEMSLTILEILQLLYYSVLGSNYWSVRENIG